jgi:hypothetical protein
MRQQLREKPVTRNHFAPAELTETEVVNREVTPTKRSRRRAAFPWARLLGVALCLSAFTLTLAWYANSHYRAGDRYLWGFYGVTSLTTFLWGWRSRRWEGALSTPLLAIATMGTLILYLALFDRISPPLFYPELLRLAWPMVFFGVLGSGVRTVWNRYIKRMD